MLAELKTLMKISIHTLAWRVTISFVLVMHIFFISIHTLAWRVTRRIDYIVIHYTDFNPHPRVEGDPSRLLCGSS